MNIHCAALSHESNTFNPLTVTVQDFDVESPASNRTPRPDALSGIIAGLTDAGLHPRASLRARALPGGPVEEAAYQELAELFLHGAADADGACVFCHGAMRTTERDYADADLIVRLREEIGPEKPLVVALDLHANITAALVEAADALVTYRTAPHIDVYETGKRAASMLARIISEGLKPAAALSTVPILMPGEMAQSDNEPMKSLLARARDMENDPRIMSVSIAKAHCWADVPEIGCHVVVVAPDSRSSAQDAADELAQTIWQRREEFRATVETYEVEESIRVAMSAPQSTVFLSDSGDNPGAGGTTDVPAVIEKLLELDAPRSLTAAFWDPVAVQTARKAGEGTRVKLSLGGRFDTAHGSPLPVDAEVLTVHDRSALIRVKQAEVLVSSERESIVDPEQLRSRGIEPLDYKIVVLKRGYLEPAFAAIAERSILALSPGCTNCDVTRLDYRRVRRPVYPLDRAFEWGPDGSPGTDQLNQG